MDKVDSKYLKICKSRVYKMNSNQIIPNVIILNEVLPKFSGKKIQDLLKLTVFSLSVLVLFYVLVLHSLSVRIRIEIEMDIGMARTRHKTGGANSN